MMVLFHRTSHADEILANGFKDATGYYLTDTLWTGVWFADRPLDSNEGADGDRLLSVDISEELIADYEWIEEGKPYREWLIPAAIVNRMAKPALVDEDLAIGDGDDREGA